MKLVNCSFSNIIIHKSTGQRNYDWETHVPCYVIDWLNLLDSHIPYVSTSGQIRPIQDYVVRQQIYERYHNMFAELEEQLKRLFPHSFLWKLDSEYLQYSIWGSEELSCMDLEDVVLPRIRFLHSSDLTEMDMSQRVSICAILGYIPFPMLRNNSLPIDNELFEYLEKRNHTWIGLSYNVI